MPDTPSPCFASSADRADVLARLAGLLGPRDLLTDPADTAEVAAVVRDPGGSFSAEHGVGKLKPCMMPNWQGGVELDAMRRIKASFDPCGLMNPGKPLP
jgi:FAD/FMN-containing dehydrogenase